MVRDGQIHCLQPFSIRNTPDGTRLFLRRFNSDLEERGDREVFFLIESTSSSATFKNPDKKETQERMPPVK
jgi:hypothetical protein